MDGKNIDDLIPLVELTREHPVSVRFIEEMPFNGEGNHYPSIQKIKDPENSTSYNYSIPGYKGNIGLIAAFSRTFCGTCNRLRITAQGGLKTCLYDDGVLDIKALLRSGKSNEEVKDALLNAFQSRPLDGFEAEEKRKDHTLAHESMSTIGG